MARPNHVVRRIVLALSIVLLGAAVPVGPAGAHARLVSTDPGNGAIVATAPEVLTLQYTESVSVQADGVRLLGGDGEAVDLGPATAEGATVRVSVEGDLAQGSYVVAWRAVSADGHPIRGAFTFSVGQESELDAGLVDQAFGGGDDVVLDRLADLARALAYLGTLAAAGFVFVGGLLRRSDEPTPIRRLVTWAAGVGLVAAVAQIPIQAGSITGRGVGATFDDGVLSQAVSDGLGLSVLVTALGLLAIVVTAGLPFGGAVRRLAMGGAVVAPLGFVVSGHTRTMSPALVGYVADAAHLLAGAVWFGGLLAVADVVRCRRSADDPMGAAEAIASFSGWAGISAAVVVAAGSTLAWIEVGSLEALTSTSYGRLLMAKVGAVAVALGAAAWNRFRLVPKVAAAALEVPPADDAPRWRLLLRLVVVEVALIVVALGVTGVLVTVTPAKVAAVSGPISVSAPLGEGTVEVTVDPASPGRNDVHVYVFDAEGAPDDRFDEAAIVVELPEQDLGPFETEPVQVGPGHFQLVGYDLALGGEWSLTVTVRPDRFTAQAATVTFEVR